MKLLRKRFSRGQIFVVATLVIATLLGAMALSANVGLLYYNWMQLQKAADAAVLAGASQLTGLPDNTGTVAANAQAVAKGYACLNGINDPKNTNAAICPNPVANSLYVDTVNSVTVNASDTQVSIQLTRQVPYFFGTLIGLNKGNVVATATAQVTGSIGTYSGGLFPAGIECKSPCSFANLNPGQPVTFGQKFAGGLAPGNWDWLNVGQGTGANQLGAAIDTGHAGTFKLNQLISSSPGNKGNSNPLTTGFQNRVNRHNSKFASINPSSVCTAGGGDPTNIPQGDPLLVVVPAVDFTGCHGNCSLAIEAFAEIYLLPTSSGNQIDGCFVQEIAASSISSSSAPNLGALPPPVLIK